MTKKPIKSNQNECMWNATEQEIKQLEVYVAKMQLQGMKDLNILKRLLFDGWQAKEIKQVLSKGWKRWERRNIIYGAVFTVSVFFLLIMGLITFFGDADGLLVNLIAAVLLFCAIFSIFRLMESSDIGDREKIAIRRILLCFNRLSQRHGIQPISDSQQTYSALLNRNKEKIFLPTIDEDYHKRIFIGRGVIKGRQWWVYIVKKISNFADNKAYRDFYIFFEMEIKPVYFYFNLVSEDYEKRRYKRNPSKLQRGKANFLDFDFPSNKFNNLWKLRGDDRRLAYQVFGTYMLELLLKINQKSLVGLEISETSVMLSKLFDKNSISEVSQDVLNLYNICKQIERNYRK